MAGAGVGGADLRVGAGAAAAAGLGAGGRCLGAWGVGVVLERAAPARAPRARETEEGSALRHEGVVDAMASLADDWVQALPRGSGGVPGAGAGGYGLGQLESGAALAAEGGMSVPGAAEVVHGRREVGTGQDYYDRE